jgi:hypothetical protein
MLRVCAGSCSAWDRWLRSLRLAAPPANSSQASGLNEWTNRQPSNHKPTHGSGLNARRSFTRSRSAHTFVRRASPTLARTRQRSLRTGVSAALSWVMGSTSVPGVAFGVSPKDWGGGCEWRGNLRSAGTLASRRDVGTDTRDACGPQGRRSLECCEGVRSFAADRSVRAPGYEKARSLGQPGFGGSND